MKQENLNYKKIKDQVIVITGASSGIGLATALMAAKKGARLVLASRNTSELEDLCRKIRRDGGKAIAVTADISEMADVDKLKKRALKEFGRVDTWVNNAGVSIYGTVSDTPLDEAKQLFETNFWGLHYGCTAAMDAMKNNEAGMIINLGSEVSERAIGLQTFYSASKHAVKGYTEGLRTEIEKQNLPIGMTLVRPAGIDTPYVQHAVNHLDRGEPSLPAPVYHPNVVADAILECAETGKRDVFVGGASKFFSSLEHIAPRLLDFMVEYKLINDQKKGAKYPHKKSNEGLMNAPAEEGHLQGGYKGHVQKVSLWSTVSLHPLTSMLALAGVGAAVLGGVSLLKEKKPGAGVDLQPKSKSKRATANRRPVARPSTEMRPSL